MPLAVDKALRDWLATVPTEQLAAELFNASRRRAYDGGNGAWIWDLLAMLSRKQAEECRSYGPDYVKSEDI